jgi:ABC-type nickel/cobalt efflux system permease component RcnA
MKIVQSNHYHNQINIKQMQPYLLLITLLIIIYTGYLFIQRKEKRMMKRYYGYKTSRRSQELKKAA